MSVLSQILNDMLFDATALPNRPISRKLKNGLHNALRPSRVTVCNIGAQFNLSLSRDSEFPSRNEWETVLKHWPYYVEKKTEPGRDILNHRMTLHAKVEKQAVSQMKFA